MLYRAFCLVPAAVTTLLFLAIPPGAPSEQGNKGAGLAYQMKGVFRLPAKNPSTVPADTVFAALPDGRIIASDGTEVFVEKKKQSRDFDNVGQIPTTPPGFLQVSPNGSKAAIGDKNSGSVVVFAPANPKDNKTFKVADYDAAWYDENLLAIATNDKTGAIVTVLDTTTGNNSLIIKNVGRGSGGVAFDKDGNIYVGDGYEPKGPGAGMVKTFTKADWRAALKNGQPLDFKKDGKHVATLLSAASLGFDRDANFLVGGGIVFGDGADDPKNRGCAFVAAAQAIKKAATGMGAPVTPASPGNVLQRLAPVANDQNSWFLYPNSRAGEIYLRAYGDTVVFVFAP